jgi:hypothetical protein
MYSWMVMLINAERTQSYSLYTTIKYTGEARDPSGIIMAILRNSTMPVGIWLIL